MRMIVYILIFFTSCNGYVLKKSVPTTDRSAREVKNVAEVQLRQEFASGEPKKLLEEKWPIIREQIVQNRNVTNTTQSTNASFGSMNVTKNVIYSTFNIKKDIAKIPGDANTVRPSEDDSKTQNKKSEMSTQSEQVIQIVESSFHNFTKNVSTNLAQQQYSQETYYKKQERPGLIGQLLATGTQEVINNIGVPTSTKTPQRQNFINNVISSFTNQNLDESTNSPGFLQGAISQFVNNFRPTTTTTTTTTQRTPIETIQNFGNQIGSAIQASIFQRNNKTTASGASVGSTTPGLAQNFVQAFQSVNPFQPQAYSANSNAPFGNNPMEMFMCFNVGKMVQTMRGKSDE